MGRWANKYVIGLTGNIAMGKSLVRKMLENLGAYTIDADGLAHQVMAPGAPAYAPVITAFGTWIVDSERKIDRQKLGAVAFSHQDALNLLEKLTHPVVGQAIDILINRAKQPIVVVEAIKMVDGVLGNQVDAIWVVDATPEVQLERLKSKRGMSDWEARKRIDTQNPQRDKLARATVVITNNGSAEDVWTQVQREWLKVTQPGKQSPQPDTGKIVVNDMVAEQGRLGALDRRPQDAAPVIAAAAVVAAAPGIAQPTSAPPATPPPAPPAAPPAPVVAPPAPVEEPRRGTQPLPPLPPGTPIDIRRGLPKNADAIAKLLSQATGKQVSRMDIMMAFGEKSYLLAEAAGRVVGLAGFQVENLITRMDEFFITPEAPIPTVAPALIAAVEVASKELQSEVGFIFLLRSSSQALLQQFIDQGYERIEIEQLKVPAWREAAQEMQTPERQILMKKLRAERVLKPV